MDSTIAAAIAFGNFIVTSTRRIFFLFSIAPVDLIPSLPLPTSLPQEPEPALLTPIRYVFLRLFARLLRSLDTFIAAPIARTLPLLAALLRRWAVAVAAAAATVATEKRAADGNGGAGGADEGKEARHSGAVDDDHHDSDDGDKEGSDSAMEEASANSGPAGGHTERNRDLRGTYPCQNARTRTQRASHTFPPAVMNRLVRRCLAAMQRALALPLSQACPIASRVFAASSPRRPPSRGDRHNAGEGSTNKSGRLQASPSSQAVAATSEAATAEGSNARHWTGRRWMANPLYMAPGLATS